jgi:hypothetical protein
VPQQPSGSKTSRTDRVPRVRNGPTSSLKSIRRLLIPWAALAAVGAMAATRAQFNDFRSYYWAVTSVFSDPAAVYGAIPWAAFGRMVPRFTYPPTTILFLLPLSWFSTSTAAGVLFCASIVGAGVVSLVILPRFVSPDRAADGLESFITVTTLFNYPLYVTLISGQINVVVALLIAAFLASRSRARTLFGSASLALAIGIKIYPVLFLVPLVLKRKFAEVSTVCLLTALFAAATLLVLPPVLWKEWFAQVVAPGPGAYGRLLPGLEADLRSFNLSFNGTFIRLLGPGESAAKLALCSGLLMLGVSVFRIGRQTPLSCREAAVVALVMFCASPMSWIHHLSFVIPFVALALPSARFRWTAIAAYAALCVKWDWPWGSLRLADVAIPTIAAVTLWVALVVPDEEHAALEPPGLPERAGSNCGPRRGTR